MRKIISIHKNTPTLEGAGVKLKRVFGAHEVPTFDPFLLLDHFGSDNPEEYIKGFPWHPHRGIETVTYMIAGEVKHGDSIGNKGAINSGEVQWMTAGSGIIHQEMPQPFKGESKGFQLWVNLPQKNKMTAPRYKELTKKDLVHTTKDDAKVIILSGTVNGKTGPIEDLFVKVEYFDIHLDGKFTHKTDKKTAFIYAYEGKMEIEGQKVSADHCALLEKKGDIIVSGKGKFIFVAGNPLDEPIVWGGPIVMNTEKELQDAFKELDEGRFIKGKEPEQIEKDFYKD